MKTIRHHADSTGRVTQRDTLRDAPVDSVARVSVTRKITGGVSTSWIEIPFAPRFLRAEGPGGQLAEANSANYEILWLDPDLKVTRTLRATTIPVAVTTAEIDAARDSISEFASHLSAQVDPRSVRIPASKPALVSLGFDLDGRLWVERSVAQGQPREADVYDSRGSLVAHATWPADVDIKYHAIRGMTGLGIRIDPGTDVPSIVRLTFRQR